jgi:hypothetical protein
VPVDYTTDIDEARDLGEVDEDPPAGDFNDAASLVLIRLAGECGCEDAGEMSTLDLYRFISESVYRPSKRVEVPIDRGTQVGDRVRIDSKPTPRCWVDSMDDTLGKTGEVEEILDGEFYVNVDGDGWWYSAECIVKVQVEVVR